MLNNWCLIHTTMKKIEMEKKAPLSIVLCTSYMFPWWLCKTEGSGQPVNAAHVAPLKVVVFLGHF